MSISSLAQARKPRLLLIRNEVCNGKAHGPLTRAKLKVPLEGIECVPVHGSCFSRRAALSTGAVLATSTFLPGRAALRNEDIKKAYDRYAPTYDNLDGGDVARALGFPELRQNLLAQASGKVLEVGAGTGLNMGMYNWEQLSRLTLLDISDGMLTQAHQRAALLLPGKPITVQQGDVTQLPFEAGSFDVVVDTFSMCVFAEPVQALREMRRVLAPQGFVLLLEHSKSSNPLLAAYQDLTVEPVAAMGKGCAWNQDLPELLKQAGWKEWHATMHLGGLISSIKVTS